MTRKEYIEKAKEKLDQFDTKIDKIEQQTREARDKTIKEMDDQIRQLSNKRAEAKTQLKNLQQVSEEKYESARADFEKTLEENFFDRIKFQYYEMEARVKNLIMLADDRWDTFSNQAKEQINSINERINELEKKAVEYSGTAQERVQEEIGHLKKRQKELQERLNELSGSGEGAWQDLKKGFIEAGATINSAMKKAFSQLSSKPEAESSQASGQNQE